MTKSMTRNAPDRPALHAARRGFARAILMLVWMAALPALPGQSRAATRLEEISQEQFLQLFDSNRLARATILHDPQARLMRDITGAYFKSDATGNSILEKGDLVEVPFTAKVRLTEVLEKKLLASAVVTASPPGPSALAVVYALLPFLVAGLVIGLMTVLIRYFGLGGSDR